MLSSRSSRLTGKFLPVRREGREGENIVNGDQNGLKKMLISYWAWDLFFRYF